MNINNKNKLILSLTLKSLAVLCCLKMNLKSSLFSFTAQFAPKPLEPPQPAKHERVFNFLSVPFQLERVKYQIIAIEVICFLFSLLFFPSDRIPFFRSMVANITGLTIQM